MFIVGLDILIVDRIECGILLRGKVREFKYVCWNVSFWLFIDLWMVLKLK